MEIRGGFGDVAKPIWVMHGVGNVRRAKWMMESPLSGADLAKRSKGICLDQKRGDKPSAGATGNGRNEWNGVNVMLLLCPSSSSSGFCIPGSTLTAHCFPPK